MVKVLKLGSWHTEEGEVGASEDVSRAPAIANIPLQDIPFPPTAIANYNLYKIWTPAISKNSISRFQNILSNDCKIYLLTRTHQDISSHIKI